MNHSRSNPAPAEYTPRWLAVLSLALVAPLASGCHTVINGQAAVPGTNQRIVVGHDGAPFKKVWVLEDGKLHDVKVVKGAK